MKTYALWSAVLMAAACCVVWSLAAPAAPAQEEEAAKAMPVVTFKDDVFGPLAVSPALRYRNLTVFMLYSLQRAGEEPREYITLAEGIRSGQVLITEDEHEQVHRLLVTNTSQAYLFIQIGELVTGGKQDRTLQTSLVIPPGSKNVPIPSFCVEAHRWSGGKGFSAPGMALSDKGANAAAQSDDQSRVWSSVANYKSRAAENAGKAANKPAKESKSSSINEELQDKDFKVLAEAYEEALGGAIRKVDRPVGMVTMIDGKISTGNIYHRETLFRKLYPMLLRTAAAEAAAGKADTKPLTTVTPGNVADFVKACREGKKNSQELDYGNEYIRWISERIITSQLNFKGMAIHAQILNVRDVKPASDPPLRMNEPPRRQMRDSSRN